MFLASDVIKRHFGAHTENQENSLLPVAKHFIGLCLAKRRLKQELFFWLPKNAYWYVGIPPPACTIK